MLVALIFSVGEHQGGVKGVGTVMVVGFGKRGSEHAINRGSGASQSASAVCQHAWTNAVTA